MEQISKWKLDEVAQDLESAERELDSVAEELNFMRGMGEQFCINRLYCISKKFHTARQQLQGIGTKP